MAHKAVFFNLEPWAKDYIAKSEKLKTAGVEAGFEDHPLDTAHPAADPSFDIAGIFVESKMDAPVIDSLANLKLVATLSTGFDHIDIKACAEKGITVSSVPSYGENTVAEFAFGLILALSRKICDAHCAVREEGDFSTTNLRGFDLAGKTIGVVGTGRIGQHVVRIAKGFDMKVVAYDPYPNQKFAEEQDFEYKALDDLLAISDIVTLHVPYMPATHHLINKENIGKMKNGAYLVNTSRGPVVETEALVSTLASKQLAGAGLDVLEEEGIMKEEMEYVMGGQADGHDLKVALEDHVLIDMPNVIITPHNAFNTQEAFTRILDTTIDNIVAFAQGTPTNVVKPAA